MNFGKLDNLGAVDFALPKDHPDTTLLLKKLKPAAKEPIRFYLGCAKWGRPDWIGRLYPKGTKSSDFLSQYVQHYNAIELNALFYNLQPKKVIEKWAAIAHDDFRFCPKYSNSISHLRQLRNADIPTDKYIDHMLSFGEKLGPCFLQLSDRFAPNRADVIRDYLTKLPIDFKTVIELRNPLWFEKTKVVDDTFSLFRKLGIGTVITDTSGRRDCLHMRLTTPSAFIRWVGNDLHASDFQRIDSWVQRIASWIKQGLREVYFFIHTNNEKYSPELSKYAAEQFNLHCGTSLRIPDLLKEGKGKDAPPKRIAAAKKVSKIKKASGKKALPTKKAAKRTR